MHSRMRGPAVHNEPQQFTLIPDLPSVGSVRELRNSQKTPEFVMKPGSAARSCCRFFGPRSCMHLHNSPSARASGEPFDESRLAKPGDGSRPTPVAEARRLRVARKRLRRESPSPPKPA